MADTKISALTELAAGALDTAADFLAVVDTSATATKKLTPANFMSVAQIASANGAASTPPLKLNGTWFSGGSATTTKPAFLVEPTGTTSTGWDTGGTGLGANAPSGFAGNLLDLQVAGTRKLSIGSDGTITQTGSGTILTNAGTLKCAGDSGGAALGVTGLYLANAANNTKLRFSSTTAWSGTADLFLERGDAATLQLGEDVNGAAVAQGIKAHDGITGTNISGASLTLSGGVGTGSGTGASLVLSTATTLASGTTAQTLVARLTLSQGVVTTDAATLTFADKVDMAFNGTTGTKIGTATTQKIGFWNTTPVVQQTSGIASGSFSGGTSGITDDTAEYDGWKIGGIVAALKACGILGA